MNNLDYSKVFEVLVKETANYVKVNNLKAMVLGISGGIDSTVVAAICHEVSKQTGFILKTDYRTYLPYCVKWDDDSTSWVIGCTITPEDSIIEESIGDEIVLTLENGFSREVTFYERN